MKAELLAAMLLESPWAEVTAWNPDEEQFMPITGMVLSGDGMTIELQTDIEP